MGRTPRLNLETGDFPRRERALMSQYLWMLPCGHIIRVRLARHERDKITVWQVRHNDAENAL